MNAKVGLVIGIAAAIVGGTGVIGLFVYLYIRKRRPDLLNQPKQRGEFDRKVIPDHSKDALGET